MDVNTKKKNDHDVTILNLIGLKHILELLAELV